MANISECFDMNFIFLRIFGVPWPGKKSGKFYTCYSYFYLSVTLITYYLLLVLNMCYTPGKIDILIRETLYFFSEIAAAIKALMIIFKQKSIVKALYTLDCNAFKGEDIESKKIVNEYIKKIKIFWKFIVIMSNASVISKMLVQAGYCIFGDSVELPYYNFYFLNRKTIDKYFAFLWLYQAVCLYGHMNYNTSVDTLICGLMINAIAQVKILDREFRYLKCNEEQISKLQKYLVHYDLLLQYVWEVQGIISVTIFLQFCIASVSICVILSSFLMQETSVGITSTQLHMLIYTLVMVLQIYVPSYLGTQLSYSSQELVNAAYSSDWMSKSKGFKNHLQFFMFRANKAIVFSGCGFFPLTLASFTLIMKTAYSFFALVKNVQNSDGK